MKAKYILYPVLVLAGFLALAFSMQWLGLKNKEYFKPKHADVERKTFEKTKSYLHGVTQDLAKYYEEYQDPTKQESIKNIIRARFPEIDAADITNLTLRSFLTTTRGY